MDFVREILLESIKLTLRRLLRIITLHALAVSAFVLACLQLSTLRPWRAAEVTIPDAAAFLVFSAIEQAVLTQTVGLARGVNRIQARKLRPSILHLLHPNTAPVW